MIYVVGKTAAMAQDWVKRASVEENWEAGTAFCVLTSENGIRGRKIDAEDRLVYVGPVYERRDFWDIEIALRFATADPYFTTRIEYTN